VAEWRYDFVFSELLTLDGSDYSAVDPSISVPWGKSPSYYLDKRLIKLESWSAVCRF
jgi:hypothetical protein